MIRSNDEDDYEYTDQVAAIRNFAATATSKDLTEPLSAVVNELIHKFGTWKIPWGSINRFQRISGDIDQQFDDRQQSIPVGYAASTWGMLPSFASSYYPRTQKRYGLYGNSFICAVEFGKKVVAKSLLAGGESGHPDSKHFTDQAEMYTKGQFKEVLYYKEDVLKHAERSYHPGE